VDAWGVRNQRRNIHAQRSHVRCCSSVDGIGADFLLSMAEVSSRRLSKGAVKIQERHDSAPLPFEMAVARWLSVRKLHWKERDR